MSIGLFPSSGGSTTPFFLEATPAGRMTVRFVFFTRATIPIIGEFPFGSGVGALYDGVFVTIVLMGTINGILWKPKITVDF